MSAKEQPRPAPIQRPIEGAAQYDSQVWEAEGVKAYEQEVKKRQAFAEVKRGELYADGEIIVEFLRLSNDSARVFQQQHPRYFPQDFWTRTLKSSTEDLYASAVSVSGPLPNLPALPYWQAYRDVLAAAWACGFADEYVLRLLNVSTRPDDEEDVFKQQTPSVQMTRTLEFSPLHPFQQDILTLVRSTWRAKLCDYCHKPFVADKPARRFCPERYATDAEMSCYKQHRREVKRDLWGKHGKEWRRPAKSQKRETGRNRGRRPRR